MSGLDECLRGIRVLDLSRYLPGPLATLLLADLGAEVLKIEPPNGDAMTSLGPCGTDGEPLFFTMRSTAANTSAAWTSRMLVCARISSSLSGTPTC
jgi:crotonobetainyl-CoA:carnitine CoA-transferase CaiB-like acyl-CoA transferase